MRHWGIYYFWHNWEKPWSSRIYCSSDPEKLGSGSLSGQGTQNLFSTSLRCLLIARKLMIQYGMLRLVTPSPSPHPPASRAPLAPTEKSQKKYQGDCLISASEISDKPSRSLIHIQHSKWTAVWEMFSAFQCLLFGKERQQQVGMNVSAKLPFPAQQLSPSAPGVRPPPLTCPLLPHHTFYGNPPKAKI